MRILTILLILISGALLLWGMARLVSSPSLYEAVHAAGHRAGMVLPQGYDGGSELRHDQLVRMDQQMGGIELSHPDRPPASKKAEFRERSKSHGLLSGSNDRSMVTLILMACICGALIAAALVRRWSNEDGDKQADRTQLQQRMLRACLLVLPVGLVIGPLFMLARIFWTGVDDAFIERSMLVRPDSHSIHVIGDTTLSMNMPELLMLYLAVIMTAVPTMFMIALHAMGGLRGVRIRWTRSRISAPARGLLAVPAVHNRFNSRSLIGVALICYLLLTVVMWCAPWSTTMARAMWSY